MGGTAQGADEVANVVALVQIAQGDGGEAHLLENDGNSAFLPVVAGDGQGNTLTHLIDAENDELAGLGLAGHEGGLDLQQTDAGVEILFAHDLVHKVCFLSPKNDMVFDANILILH